MQLREYIEQATQNTDNLSHKERIEQGRKKLFDFDYPIFDSSYKGIFETNFIRNFYMREIGFETEGLFKFQLETWLNINMPYFNKMFESELLDFNPLYNSLLETSHTKTKDTDGEVDTSSNKDNTNTNTQSSNGTQNNSTFGREIESDTPDNRLAITTNDGSGIIQYASKIDEETNKSSGTTTNKVDGSITEKGTTKGNTITDITELETYVQTKQGKVGSQSYSKMVQEYRETFLRIEKQIFEEMQQLFMLVY